VTKIEGIFTPTVVPLDDRGEINEGELRRYLDWLIASRQPLGEQQRARAEKILDTMAPHLAAMGYDNLDEFCAEPSRENAK